MRQIVTLTLLLTFTLSFSQTRLDSLITQLKQQDFDKIFRVKDNIVNTQKEAIPKLIELLKDTTYIKLQNTADLIYPGADKFYGHGWIVNYDIDWVSVRAAWLLEEITFQNFGYSDLQISEEKLMNLHKQNYTSYLETGSHNIDFKNRNPRQQLIIYRLMLADRVSKWWKKEKQSWTRFNALKEALSSNDEKRQSLALNYYLHKLLMVSCFRVFHYCLLDSTSQHVKSNLLFVLMLWQNLPRHYSPNLLEYIQGIDCFFYSFLSLLQFQLSTFFFIIAANDRGYGHLAVCGSIRCRETTK